MIASLFALLIAPLVGAANYQNEAELQRVVSAMVEARLLAEKPLPSVPSAGYTRAGPGAGQVGNHAKPPDHEQRMARLHGRRMMTESAPSAPPFPPFAKTAHPALIANFGDIDTTMDHTWILLAGLLCWFLQGGFALLEVRL